MRLWPFLLVRQGQVNQAILDHGHWPMSLAILAGGGHTMKAKHHVAPLEKGIDTGFIADSVGT
jgi:hypothetical protein